MTAGHVYLFGKVRLSERQHLVFNAATFQLAWLACVLGGSWVAAVVTVAVVTLHLNVVTDTRREAVFLAMCAAAGFVCDLALIQLGVINPGHALPPLWLSCLWVLFGTTAGYALRFFHGRLALCVAAGALFAPVSYFGGSRMADVVLLEPLWAGLLSISLAWAMMFPLLIHLYTINKSQSVH